MSSIVDFYNTYFNIDTTTDPKSSLKVGWTSKEEQYTRFAILLNVGVKDGDKILDYGCGLGHLVDYLESKNLNVNYTGIDINPKYIQKACELYNNYSFITNEIEDVDEEYDWVIASGVFTVDLTGEEISNKISKVYSLSKKGFVFNLLLYDEEFEKYGFNSFDPYQVLTELKKVYDNVYLITGYLHDDFTIYITKEPLNYDLK